MKKRWLKTLLIGAAVMILATLAAGICAYLNLRDVVVWFANRGHPRLVLGLRRAELHSGRVEFFDLVLKLRENNEEAVHIDSAVIAYSWRDLRERCIGAVTINKPRIRISDRLLGPGGGPGSAKTASTDTNIWRVKKFAVLAGEAEIDLAAAPRVRFSFAPEFHDLHLSTGAKFASQQQSLALEGIELLSRAAKPEQVGTIKRIELKFSQLEAGQMNFDELVVESPSFRITPEALKGMGPRMQNRTSPRIRTKPPPMFPTFASANCASKTARRSFADSATPFPKARSNSASPPTISSSATPARRWKSGTRCSSGIFVSLRHLPRSRSLSPSTRSRSPSRRTASRDEVKLPPRL